MTLCWLRNDQQRTTNGWAWGLLYSWVAMAYMIGMGISVYCWLLWRGGIPATMEIRKNAILRSQINVVCFSGYAFFEVCTQSPGESAPSHLMRCLKGWL